MISTLRKTTSIRRRNIRPPSVTPDAEAVALYISVLPFLAPGSEEETPPPPPPKSPPATAEAQPTAHKRQRLNSLPLVTQEAKYSVTSTVEVVKRPPEGEKALSVKKKASRSAMKAKASLSTIVDGEEPPSDKPALSPSMELTHPALKRHLRIKRRTVVTAKSPLRIMSLPGDDILEDEPYPYITTTTKSKPPYKPLKFEKRPLLQKVLLKQFERTPHGLEILNRGIWDGLKYIEEQQLLRRIRMEEEAQYQMAKRALAGILEITSRTSKAFSRDTWKRVVKRTVSSTRLNRAASNPDLGKSPPKKVKLESFSATPTPSPD